MKKITVISVFVLAVNVMFASTNQFNEKIEKGLDSYKHKSYSCAIKCYTEAIALNNESADAFTKRSSVYIEQKKYRKAVSDIQDALDIDPDNAEAYNNLGVLHFELENYEYAIIAFETAIKKDNNINAIHNLMLLNKILDKEELQLDDEMKITMQF